MKQYEFTIFDRRTGRSDFARATAINAPLARAQIVLKYAPQYLVAEQHSNISSAHHVRGEIDCSALTLSDTAWCLREAAKAEAA